MQCPYPSFTALIPVSLLVLFGFLLLRDPHPFLAALPLFRIRLSRPHPPLSSFALRTSRSSFDNLSICETALMKSCAAFSAFVSLYFIHFGFSSHSGFSLVNCDFALFHKFIDDLLRFLPVTAIAPTPAKNTFLTPSESP